MMQGFFWKEHPYGSERDTATYHQHQHSFPHKMREGKENSPGEAAGGVLPNRVQKRAPSTGSGKDAKRALNLPTMPRASMSAAPYWITRRLPTCRTQQNRHKLTTILGGKAAGPPDDPKLAASRW